jgi:hypothetical protein
MLCDARERAADVGNGGGLAVTEASTLAARSGTVGLTATGDDS